MSEPDRWLTATEAADYTGYKPDYIREKAHSGELLGHRSGPRKGHWRFKIADLDAWVMKKDANSGQDETSEERGAA